MAITVSELLIHPLLWRVTGFVSSIVGFSCYALGPSFQGLFGQWNPLKMVIYSVVSSLISIMMLFVKRCNWGVVRSFLLKAHVGFLVLTFTSLYSFWEDKSEEGKVVEKGFGLWKSDEADFNWGICIDGYEFVKTTPTWVRGGRSPKEHVGEAVDQDTNSSDDLGYHLEDTVQPMEYFAFDLEDVGSGWNNSTKWNGTSWDTTEWNRTFLLKALAITR